MKLKEIVNDTLNIKNIEELEKYQKELLPLNDELNLEKSELEEIDFLLKSHQSFNYTNELLGSIKFDSHTKPKFIKNLKEFPELKYKLIHQFLIYSGKRTLRKWILTKKL